MYLWKGLVFFNVDSCNVGDVLIVVAESTKEKERVYS